MEAKSEIGHDDQVVVILIDHVINYNSKRNLNGSSSKLNNEIKSLELLLSDQFSESRLDFLHKQTLIYLASRFEREDFISLYPMDRKFCLALLKSLEFLNSRETLSPLLTSLNNLDEFSSDEEDIILELVRRQYIRRKTILRSNMKLLLQRPTFLHRVVLLEDKFIDLLTDKNFTMDFIKQKPEKYCLLNADMKKDRDVAKVAFSLKGSLISDSVFLSDRELIIIAITNDGSVFNKIDKHLQMDLEIINIAKQTYPKLLKYLPSSFFNDVEFAESAVKLNPHVFPLAPQKEDLEFVKRVLSPGILLYLNSNHLSDSEIRSQIENYIRESDKCFTQSSSAIKSDKQLALFAIELDPKLLAAVHIDDYDCSKLAITKDPRSIQFCSIDLLEAHFDLVELSLSLGGANVFEFIPSLFKNRTNNVIKIIEKFPYTYALFDREIRLNEKVAESYGNLKLENSFKIKFEEKKFEFNTTPTITSSTPQTSFFDFKSVTDFASTNPFSISTASNNAIFQFGNNNPIGTTSNSNQSQSIVNPFSSANKNLLPNSSVNDSNTFSTPLTTKVPSIENDMKSNDKEFIKNRLAKDPFLFRYCNENIKKDKEFIIELIKIHKGVLFQYIDNSLKEDREFVLSLIPISVTVSKFLPDKMRSDKEIILNALKSSPISHIYFRDSELFCGDQDIAYRAVKSNPKSLKSVGLEIFKDRKFVSQLFKLMFIRKKKHIKYVKTNTTDSKL